MSMSGVFDQGDAALLADAFNFIEMRRNDSAHVHQHYGLGVLSNLAAQIVGIHLKVLPLAVGEDYLCARVNRRHCCRNKRMAGNNDRLAFDIYRS